MSTISSAARFIKWQAIYVVGFAALWTALTVSGPNNRDSLAEVAIRSLVLTAIVWSLGLIAFWAWQRVRRIFTSSPPPSRS